MKRLLIAILAIGISISLFATEITKNIKVSNFDGLSVSSVYDVTVSKSNTNSLKITVSEELEEYLDITVVGNTLRLSLDSQDLPRSIRNNMRDYTLEAEVTMPTLERLKASGASKVLINDSFRVVDFQGDFSGASNVKGLDIEGDEAEIEASGASNVDVKADLSEANFDLSGASNVDIVGVIVHLNIDASGATSLDVIGTFKEFELEASGACNIDLEGETVEFKVNASGASNVDADGLVSNLVKVDASGASNIDVNPKSKIEISLSGASSLVYRGNPGLELDIVEKGRGASIRKR